MDIAFFDTKPYDKDYFGKESFLAKHTTHFFPFRLSTKTAELAKGSDTVCVFVNDKVDRECLSKLAEMNIRHVALRCAGFNNVDLEAAKELHLSVTRVPAYSPHAVAEHTLALLLTLNRKTHRAYNRVREHNFSLAGLVGFDLFQKNVGIIGAGNIGRITAEIFRGFGCKVFACDPQIDETWAKNNTIHITDFDNILAESDIISLHLPLTQQTHHLINGTAFSKMKDGCYLVNTGRGKLIDTTALLTALKSKRIGGVALDVYEEEEGVFFEDRSNEILQDDELIRLLTFPNVLVTSHQGFLTHEALEQISQITSENIDRFARKQPFIDETVLC